MNSDLVLSAFLFVASVILTWFLKLLSLKTNVLDVPNERSSHSIPTPRGGGLAVVIVWYIAVIILFSTQRISPTLFKALLCGIPIAILGLFDDLWTISPYLRLSIQLVFTSLAVFLLGGVANIDIGFTVIGGSFVLNIIAVIGVVWLINLFNFLDGIDGYLGAEVIFICIASFFLFGNDLPLLLAASTAGFLLFNWQPARIFLGDTGSTFIGFTIGIFILHFQNSGQSSIIIWLMLTSVFWFDATLTLFRRIRNREKIATAHKKHAYQRIVQFGFSHQKTVIIAMSVNCIVLFLIILALRFPSYILLFLFLNLLLLYYVIKLIDRKLPFENAQKQ